MGIWGKGKRGEVGLGLRETVTCNLLTGRMIVTSPLGAATKGDLGALMTLAPGPGC
jgi:uncharacterized cupin superfamily protein